MTTIAILGSLVALGALIYSGVRDGAFFSVYVLLRNLFGFVLAVTFMDPVAGLIGGIVGGAHPAPQYFRAIAFPLVFALVFVGFRWLKTHYTVPSVVSFTVADKVVGGICGAVNWVVVAGTLLVLWGLMPFAKYLPADFGRIKSESALLSPAKGMVRFYGYLAHRMPGGREFLLEDEPIVGDLDGDNEFDQGTGEAFKDLNRNGVWDRGWLWRFEHHADIHTTDIELAVPPKVVEEEETEGAEEDR